jgi:hypothetical protein
MKLLLLCLIVALAYSSSIQDCSAYPNCEVCDSRCSQCSWNFHLDSDGKCQKIDCSPISNCN